MKKTDFNKLAVNFKYDKSERNYTELYNGIRKPLLYYIKGIVKDQARANDIFQDVAIKIYEKIDMYNENFNFSTWSYTIARNECFIFFKNSKKAPTISISNTSENGIEISDGNQVTILDNIDTEMEFDFEENKSDIDYRYEDTMELINSLDDKYKIFLIEKYINNLKEKEIAEKLNVSKGTVKNRLFHGRSKIKKKYSEMNITV